MEITKDYRDYIGVIWSVFNADHSGAKRSAGVFENCSRLCKARGRV